MTLRTTKPQYTMQERFREVCKLFAEKKASIDYILAFIIKMRLIKEVPKKADLQEKKNE